VKADDCGSDRSRAFLRLRRSLLSSPTSSAERVASGNRYATRWRASAESVRRAPAAAATTRPPATPARTASVSQVRQRARSSAKKRIQTAATSGSQGWSGRRCNRGAHDAAVLHPHDAPSRVGNALVVCDEQDRLPAGMEPAEQLEHLEPACAIESAGRLVGEEERRLVRERARDRSNVYRRPSWRTEPVRRDVSLCESACRRSVSRIRVRRFDSSRATIRKTCKWSSRPQAVRAPEIRFLPGSQAKVFAGVVAGTHTPFSQLTTVVTQPESGWR